MKLSYNRKKICDIQHVIDVKGIFHDAVVKRITSAGLL